MSDMAIRRIAILTLVFFSLSCERNLKNSVVADNNNSVELTHQEKDIKVDFALANMIEEVVRKTKFSINISDMTRKTINIDKIDGLDVCDPKAKEKVLSLQKAFNEHPNIYRNYSFYGVWVKKPNGQFNYVSGDSAEYKKLINNCRNVYIAVK